LTSFLDVKTDSISQSTTTLSQFHQRFTHSFYARRSQKCKKDWQLDCFFTLLGSARVKAVRRMLMKLSPCLLTEEEARENFNAKN